MNKNTLKRTLRKIIQLHKVPPQKACFPPGRSVPTAHRSSTGRRSASEAWDPKEVPAMRGRGGGKFSRIEYNSMQHNVI